MHLSAATRLTVATQKSGAGASLCISKGSEAALRVCHSGPPVGLECRPSPYLFKQRCIGPRQDLQVGSAGTRSAAAREGMSGTVTHAKMLDLITDGL